MSDNLKNNCLKFGLMTVSMLIIHLALAQHGKKNVKEIGINVFEDLDALLVKNQKQLGGNVVAMVWADTLVYKHELGEFDAKTVAPLGSASKWLTAALVMKFVELGKLSLDDKISQYIPIYETYGKTYITIRHCLTNFTGIQSDGGGLFGKKKFASLQEEVESFAKKEIKTNPGTEFEYSNIGFEIAGRVLEIVSKKKFDMLMKQQLFNPLAMRKTSFSMLDGSAVSPSMGAQSTADEFMHFLLMLLHDGKYNDQQFLSQSSIDELRTIYALPEKIQVWPKNVQGFSYVPGAWALEEKDAKATALASPSLYGTWPMLDWCRGYACIIYVKSMLGEQKKDLYLHMKDAIDSKMMAECK
jgi:CubicO group peptidase (beta-lactamase class C family)